MGWERDEPNAPLLLSIPGSEYPVKNQEDYDAFVASRAWSDVPSFADMPRFQVDDVQHACQVVHAYLANEGRPVPVQQARQTKLLARSAELASSLAKLGKLAGAPSDFDAAMCGTCRPVPDGIHCGK